MCAHVHALRRDDRGWEEATGDTLAWVYIKCCRQHVFNVRKSQTVIWRCIHRGKKNIKHCVHKSSSHNAINLHEVERKNSEPLGNMRLKQVKAVHSKSNSNKEMTAKTKGYQLHGKGPSQWPARPKTKTQPRQTCGPYCKYMTVPQPATQQEVNTTIIPI